MVKQATCNSVQGHTLWPKLGSNKRVMNGNHLLMNQSHRHTLSKSDMKYIHSCTMHRFSHQAASSLMLPIKSRCTFIISFQNQNLLRTYSKILGSAIQLPWEEWKLCHIGTVCPSNQNFNTTSSFLTTSSNSNSSQRGISPSALAYYLTRSP